MYLGNRQILNQGHLLYHKCTDSDKIVLIQNFDVQRVKLNLWHGVIIEQITRLQVLDEVTQKSFKSTTLNWLILIFEKMGERKAKSKSFDIQSNLSLSICVLMILYHFKIGIPSSLCLAKLSIAFSDVSSIISNYNNVEETQNLR